MSPASQIRFEMPKRAVTRHLARLVTKRIEGNFFFKAKLSSICLGKQGRYSELTNCVSAAEIREALQHAMKVSREGSCRWPRPRVIPVRDVYPSPSTTYIPHCAILHRCSDDTGCCRSEALTCVPKLSHRVELSFYVSKSSFCPDTNPARPFAMTTRHANSRCSRVEHASRSNDKLTRDRRLVTR